jgi:hypothetical protein
MKRISLKGIPKQHQSKVRSYIAVTVGLEGKQLSPQEAYKRLQAQWKDDAEKAEQRKQEQQAEAEKNRADWAKDRANEGIRKLAYLRDFLSRATSNDTGADIVETAILASALLADAGSELEQALFDLGIAKGMGSTVKGRREGWIKEFLK